MRDLAKKCCAALGLKIRDMALLERALTHRSYSADHNERLEFVGDAVLNLVIAEALYKKFPAQAEGLLSRFRASLVNGQTLSEIAKELALGDFILLGPGEAKAGGAERASVLADTLEAVMGAIYLDSGFEICEQVVLGWYAARLEDLKSDANKKDPKTLLQEYLQSLQKPLPLYHVVSVSGKSHEQIFVVECSAKGLGAVQQTGSSRRQAEQAAASALLEKIHGNR